MKIFSLLAGATYSFKTTDAWDTTSTEYPTSPPTSPTMTTWTSVPLTTERFSDCGGSITDLSTFSSPGFGSGVNYQNYLSCTWEISLRGVAGFWIVPKTFDIEIIGWYYPGNVGTNGQPLPTCAYDYVKVIANGVESNYCGSNEEGRSDNQDVKEEKEVGKWTDDLVNASEDGFPKMFILGGQATVSMHSDWGNPGHTVVEGFEFELVEASRLDIIEYHFGRIVESLPDGKKSERYVSRFQKVLDKARASSTGENCYEENGFGASETSDDVQVFDESDMCTLNSQVNAALNSWSRNNACDGRGKVYRQIIRAARKIRNFYNSANNC